MQSSVNLNRSCAVLGKSIRLARPVLVVLAFSTRISGAVSIENALPMSQVACISRFRVSIISLKSAQIEPCISDINSWSFCENPGIERLASNVIARHSVSKCCAVNPS